MTGNEIPPTRQTVNDSMIKHVWVMSDFRIAFRIYLNATIILITRTTGFVFVSNSKCLNRSSLQRSGFVKLWLLHCSAVKENMLKFSTFCSNFGHFEQNSLTQRLLKDI